MNADLKQSSAKSLLDIGAVGFSPEAPVTFKSGLISPVYVDNRSLIYHPQAWRAVIDGFASLIDRQALHYDLLAGVALGGLPHSSALAFALSRPSVFIRKEAKGHGTGKRIEGGTVAGKRVLLIEDLVTTGGSSLSAVAALREAGAIVRDVLAIISYGFPEAASAFTRAEVSLHTLTDFDSVLIAASERQQLDDAQIAIVRAWLAAPHCWQARG